MEARVWEEFAVTIHERASVNYLNEIGWISIFQWPSKSAGLWNGPHLRNYVQDQHF